MSNKMTAKPQPSKDDFLPKLPVVTEDTINSILGDISESELNNEPDADSNDYFMDVAARIETENPVLYDFIIDNIHEYQEISRENWADEEFCDQLVAKMFCAVSLLYGTLESQLEADYYESNFQLGIKDPDAKTAENHNTPKTSYTSKLPVIKDDIFDSILKSFEDSRSGGKISFAQDVLTKIETENPWIYDLIIVTANGARNGVEAEGFSKELSGFLWKNQTTLVAFTYALLESQLEADYLNSQFGPLKD
jgi:hypothetical protein